MKKYFYGFDALVRALSTGHTVYCKETCEGWRVTNMRHVRSIARAIISEGCKTFYTIE